MATTTTTTNKPLNPRAQDLSPKGYNRAALYSGKALDFDGVNDSITTPNISTQSTNVWTYSSNIVFSSAIAYWFDARQSEFGYSVYFDSSIKKLILYTTSGITFDFEFEFNKWYSVALTSNSTTANLYVNTQLVDSKNYTNSFSITGDFFIGQRHTGGGYFGGQLSGFKAFNTALTPAQVADLYLNPEKIVPDGVSSSALKLWLPMMEGAGTTAYDGSGNGNHGTINGATWVSGIGAPVAQTALVSWNKGTNLVQYSEQFDNASWSKINTTISANATTSPDGYVNADKLIPNATPSVNKYIYRSVSAASGSVYSITIFAKAAEYDRLRIEDGNNSQGAWFNLSSGTVGTVGGSTTANIEALDNGWYKCSISKSTVTTSVFFVISGSDAENIQVGNGTSGIYIYGAQIEAGAYATSYIPTLATAQTSPVLLPQGLTANKDITGVNAFESARNPYALNLDGNSWGEVHDNASLDFGTGSFTLEAWVRFKFVNSGSGANVIMNLGGGINDTDSAGLSAQSDLSLYFWYRGTTTNAGTITQGDWVHIVGVYDETNATIYINATQENQTAPTAGSVTNEHQIYIGRDESTPAFRAYKDQIALPRIYNRALTATEVARNYNADKSKFGL